MKVLPIDDERLLKLLLKDVRIETIYVGKQLLVITQPGGKHATICDVNCHVCGYVPITKRKRKRRGS